MMLQTGFFLVIVGIGLLTLSSVTSVYHDYCVIGAGPGGLQLGYYLQKSGRDYVVFERSNKSGNFYVHYPRHRKLISINKRFTGQKNEEFNMRHDWNSLLSDDDSLRMTKYSKEMFPHADVLVQYLNDFQRRLSINVQHDSDMRGIRSVANETAPDGHVFMMEDQKGTSYICRTLIVATGIATPNIPKMEGMKYAQGYESMPLDPELYEGKSVLILGRGNTAFEVADSLYGSTSVIHMMARSRVRLAWATHYVGDLRAVNDGLLDTYQLKSLDGLFEGPVSSMSLIKKDGKIYVGTVDNEVDFDNSPVREPYDVVLRALGFTFEGSIFNDTKVSLGKGRSKKYPLIKHDYESKDHQGLFYAGTVTHSLDYRKSAGGFIHGFRYTARALHRLLDWRYEHVQWPSTSFPTTQLMNTIIKRINEASGPYQMFSVLSDVALFSRDKQEVKYIEEFPVNLVDSLHSRTGLEDTGPVLVIVMEYGQNFSGPGKDIFRSDRAVGSPEDGHMSNFLHPVLYYYETVPTAETMKQKRSKEILPRPDAIHHIVEDFLTLWTAPTSHLLPLRRFLEKITDSDQRTFFSETCFRLSLTDAEVPNYCSEHYLKGVDIPGVKNGAGSEDASLPTATSS